MSTRKRRAMRYMAKIMKDFELWYAAVQRITERKKSTIVVTRELYEEIFKQGFSPKEAFGMVTTNRDTLFGIDRDSHQLWKGEAGEISLTLHKILEATKIARTPGGIAG